MAPSSPTPFGLLAALLPKRCLACQGSADSGSGGLCSGCQLRLEQCSPLSGGQPAGLDRIWSAAEHSGVARDLVSSLKFRRQLAAAKQIGAEMAAGLPPTILTGPLVPVPSAPFRAKRRGFSPSLEIARALSSALEDRGGTPAGLVGCLRRRGESHQVGRGRGERRAARFEVWASGPVPPHPVLVDDVTTTGGTLAACAAALRQRGALSVNAVTFTRRL